MTSTIGNLGAHVDLKVIRGADCAITVQVNEDSAPKDLTGYSASLIVKHAERSTSNLLSLVPTISEVAGIISIAIADTDTDDAAWTSGIYWLNLTDDSGNITRLIDGAFTLSYRGSDDDEPTTSVTVETTNALTLDIAPFDSTRGNAVQIQGVEIEATAPTSGQGLLYDGTQYVPTSLATQAALDNEAASRGAHAALTNNPHGVTASQAEAVGLEAVENQDDSTATTVAALVDDFNALLARLVAGGVMYQPVTVAAPSGFTWDPGFTITRSSLTPSTFRTSFDIDDHIPSTAQTFYVDVATGADTNDGSEASPFKSIYKAINGRTANTLVYVKPGSYDKDNCWKTAAFAADALVVRRWPGETGRIVSSLHHTLTWSLNTGSTYGATITTVSGVYDAANVDNDGDYQRLTLRASIAEVDASPGSYFVSGTTVYVQTSDSRAPDSDIRVYQNIDNGQFSRTNGVLWVEYVDFEGGDEPFNAGSALSRYYKSCSFKYGGARNGLNVRTGGTTYCVECVCAKNWLDGFKYEKGAAASLNYVEINCTARNNGNTSTTVANGSSAHDGGIGIRVGGDYYGNFGRNIHDISASLSWALGVTARDSASSASSDVNFACGSGTDTAKMWLDNCISSDSGFDIDTSTGCLSHTYQFTGGASNTGAGTVQAYIA